MQAEVLRYQCEAVDVLYSWAQQPRALPAPGDQAIIPTTAADELDTIGTSSTAIDLPGLGAQGGAILAPAEEPGPEATHSDKATYHELMSQWHRHQADLHAQAWRVEVQEQLDGLQFQLEAEKTVTDLIPEILQRLGPETINTQQQRQVQAYVHQLHLASGKHQATIYDELKTAFDCPRYQELRADEWPQVVAWFKVQLQRAKG
jgi:hypothetical protein